MTVLSKEDCTVVGNVVNMSGSCYYQTAIHGAIHGIQLVRIVERNMVKKTAYIGGFQEVEVEIDKYPVYYLIKTKFERDPQPVAFLVVKTEEDDIGFPVSVIQFVRENFDRERMTQAEAESYEVFGVAPIFTPEEFATWLIAKKDEIEGFATARALQEIGLSKRDGTRFNVKLPPKG